MGRCDHLSDEKESDGRSEHIGSDAGEIVGQILGAIELRGIEFTSEPVNRKSNGNNQQPSLNRGISTVA